MQNVYLFVEKLTPEIIADAQDQGISCVYEGIPAQYQSQAAQEGWVLPHQLIYQIEISAEDEDVL